MLSKPLQRAPVALRAVHACAQCAINADVSFEPATLQILTDTYCAAVIFAMTLGDIGHATEQQPNFVSRSFVISCLRDRVESSTELHLRHSSPSFSPRLSIIDVRHHAFK